MIDPQECIAASSGHAGLVINLSGGKDSTRMLGHVRSLFPQIPTYCVMADTGFEHVRPVPAVEWSRYIAERFGLDLHVVRNPNKTYLEMVRARGKFPSAQFRQCTSDLKRGSIQKFIPQLRIRCSSTAWECARRSRLGVPVKWSGRKTKTSARLAGPPSTGFLSSTRRQKMC